MNDEMTPQQKRRLEEHDKEQDQFYRNLNNGLQFWTACKQRRCRRARACGGESHACFRRNWRAMPEGDRAFFRAVLRALGEGRTPAEVKRIGEDVRARFAALGAGPSPVACIQTDPSRVS